MEKQKKYDRLKFYYVNEDYAGFLRKNYDQRVPNISADEYKNKKFFIGIVMKINGFDYLAPVSSYTQENEFTFNIKDKDETIISSVRPNYMFPVIKGTYDVLQFNKIKSKYYKYLLREEWNFCNKNRGAIYELAKKLYDKKSLHAFESSNERKMYEAMCSNFKRLERGATAYRDRQSKLLSDREQTLVDKYPVNADKILQLKKVFAKTIENKPDQFAALEQCIRTHIKLAPEVYGKEISERIAKEDLAAKKKATTKVVAKTPVKKTQEKITKKEPQKKKPQNSR